MNIDFVVRRYDTNIDFKIMNVTDILLTDYIIYRKLLFRSNQMGQYSVHVCYCYVSCFKRFHDNINTWKKLRCVSQGWCQLG